MALERFFLGTFDLFDRFEDIFDPIWVSGAIGPLLDQNNVHFGNHFGGDFGPFVGRSGVILGSLQDDFGIVLASLCGPFWCRFDPIWDHFGLVFGLWGGA